MSMTKIPHRLYLTEDQMPKQWFNLRSPCLSSLTRC